MAAAPEAPPRTFRIDLLHTGGMGQELFALERMVLEPLPWPGNPDAPIDPTGWGKYLFEVRDLETQRLLYSRGYSSIWLASGARVLGGRLVSLESDPAKCAAWRSNIASAGLDEWAELVEGDAHETLARTEDVFDLVFLDAEKDDYEALFALARPLLEPGGLVVADNVLSHVDTLGAYSAARQVDGTLSSVTVPFDRGLEVSVVLGSAT